MIVRRTWALCYGLLCWLSAGLANAQTAPFNGTITDAHTGKGVPFANIGVVGKTVGTVADEQGHYQLPFVPALAHDTVRISSLGYAVQQLPLQQLAGHPSRQLLPAAVALASVVVTSRNSFRRTHILGNTGDSDASANTLSANDLGAQVGTIIHLAHHPARVLTANFNIARPATGTVTFRVNLYRLDSKGQPTAEKLLARDVLLTSPLNKGTLTVDLRADNVVVDNDFLLALEMLRWDGRTNPHAEVTFSAAVGYTNNQLYARPASQADWTRTSIGAILAGMQPKISFFVLVQD